jgi:hypothetical protein
MRGHTNASVYDGGIRYFASVDSNSLRMESIPGEAKNWLESTDYHASLPNSDPTVTVGVALENNPYSGALVGGAKTIFVAEANAVTEQADGMLEVGIMLSDGVILWGSSGMETPGPADEEEVTEWNQEGWGNHWPSGSRAAIPWTSDSWIVVRSARKSLSITRDADGNIQKTRRRFYLRNSAGALMPLAVQGAYDENPIPFGGGEAQYLRGGYLVTPFAFNRPKYGSGNIVGKEPTPDDYSSQDFGGYFNYSQIAPGDQFELLEVWSVVDDNGVAITAPEERSIALSESFIRAVLGRVLVLEGDGASLDGGNPAGMAEEHVEAIKKGAYYVTYAQQPVQDTILNFLRPHDILYYWGHSTGTFTQDNIANNASKDFPYALQLAYERPWFGWNDFFYFSPSWTGHTEEAAVTMNAMRGNDNKVLDYKVAFFTACEFSNSTTVTDWRRMLNLSDEDLYVAWGASWQYDVLSEMGKWFFIQNYLLPNASGAYSEMLGILEDEDCANFSEGLSWRRNGCNGVRDAGNIFVNGSLRRMTER